MVYSDSNKEQLEADPKRAMQARFEIIMKEKKHLERE